MVLMSYNLVSGLVEICAVRVAVCTYVEVLLDLLEAPALGLGEEVKQVHPTHTRQHAENKQTRTGQGASGVQCKGVDSPMGTDDM